MDGEGASESQKLAIAVRRFLRVHSFTIDLSLRMGWLLTCDGVPRRGTPAPASSSTCAESGRSVLSWAFFHNPKKQTGRQPTPGLRRPVQQATQAIIVQRSLAKGKVSQHLIRAS
jgi:hypothetical protein